MKIAQKILAITILLICSTVTVLYAQEEIYLWKDVAQMEKEKTRLYLYPAPDSINNGKAIIVCPGGSYHHLGMPHEGHQVAAWLNSNGYNAFVLRYRVGMHGYQHPAMIIDLQKAILYVRLNAGKYRLKENCLGVMGFSAGGHLALLSGIAHQDHYLKAVGLTPKANLRPDFIVAVYPVVSMQDEIAHQKSRDNLLGKHCSQTDKDNFSIEKNIPKDMPPTMIIVAKDDPVVNYRNSIVLDEALTNNHIRHQLLLYEQGGHGFGMSEKRGGNIALWKWDFIKWQQTLQNTR